MLETNHQPDLWASGIICLVASTAAILSRGYARHVTKQPLGLDDYFILISYVLAVAYQIITFYWISQGLGLHFADVDWYTPAQAVYVSSQLMYAVELCYAATLAFSKLAVLAFYWRLFKTSQIRLPIQLLMAAVVLWLIVRTVLAVFHCWPVQGFWDKSIEARCIDDSVFLFWSVMAHLLLDLSILTLPVVQVSRMRLQRRQKMGILVLFGFGIVVCGASLMTMIWSKIFNVHTPEFNFDVAPIMIWANVETNLAVFCACLPLLRPLYGRFLDLLGVRSTTDGSGAVKTFSTKQKSFIRLHNRGGRSTKGGGGGGAEDESDSIHKLACGGGDYSDGASTIHGFGGGAVGGRGGRGQSRRGPQVTITGNDNDDLERGPSPEQGGGIMVRSETSVRVSTAR